MSDLLYFAGRYTNATDLLNGHLPPPVFPG